MFNVFSVDFWVNFAAGAAAGTVLTAIVQHKSRKQLLNDNFEYLKRKADEIGKKVGIS